MNQTLTPYLIFHFLLESLIWFGLILWHINHCRLFNVKFPSYIYQIYWKMVDFGKSDKMIKISGKVDEPNTDNEFNISFFIGNRTSMKYWIHCQCLVYSLFQLFLSYKIYSYITCKHIFLITFWNEPKLLLLHTVKWFQLLLCITNNSIRHLTFFYPQLNDQTVLFQNNSI